MLSELRIVSILGTNLWCPIDRIMLKKFLYVIQLHAFILSHFANLSPLALLAVLSNLWMRHKSRSRSESLELVVHHRLIHRALEFGLRHSLIADLCRTRGKVGRRRLITHQRWQVPGKHIPLYRAAHNAILNGWSWVFKHLFNLLVLVGWDYATRPEPIRRALTALWFRGMLLGLLDHGKHFFALKLSIYTIK